MLCKLVVFVY